jgi:TPR repeat protein
MRWLAFALLAGCLTSAGQTERHCRSRAAGAGESCLRAGEAAMSGQGRRRDPSAARELWDIGCRLGQGEACLSLAEHLRSGSFGEPDPVAAKRVLQLGCDGTSAACCVELAKAAAALGRDQKVVEALNRACNKGDRGACVDLAESHEAAEDRPRALAAWVRACRLGDAHACNLVNGANVDLPIEPTEDP